jgi:hypothetical protein
MTAGVSVITVSSALDIVRTLLAPSPEAWAGLARSIDPAPGARGLDVLAEAMGRRAWEAQAGMIWDALHEPLFRRLLDALWEDDHSLACQAAELAVDMGDGFVTPLVQALTAEKWSERRRAAAQLARLALLVGQLPGVELRPSVTPPPDGVRVSITPGPGDPDALPIPVVNLADARQMLLLVDGETYKLRVDTPPTVDAIRPVASSRVHCLVIASDLPVKPSFHQATEITVGSPLELDFRLAPNEVTLDRLTVHMLSDGRGHGWLADFGVFVTDTVVLKGLKGA